MSEDQLPTKVDLPTLCSLICMSEAEIEAMVKSGELPKPDKEGKWRWVSVDLALAHGTLDRWLIYFLEMGSFIKIGCTRDLQRRLKTIADGVPLPVVLLHTEVSMRDGETDLHRRFKHLRTRGEWYRKTDELMSYIESRKNIGGT